LNIWTEERIITSTKKVSVRASDAAVAAVQNFVVNSKRLYNISIIHSTTARIDKMPFSLRVKINQNEVEISGAREEVLKTVEDLPKLVENISKAFTHIYPKAAAVEKTVEKTSEAPITVRLASTAAAGQSKVYPSIKQTKNCSEAVVKLLETEWGTWRPRTLPEIVDALKANAVHYPSTTLSGVLSWLVKRGKVKRWKTDAGYVYILAEKETA